MENKYLNNIILQNPAKKRKKEKKFKQPNKPL